MAQVWHASLPVNLIGGVPSDAGRTSPQQAVCVSWYSLIVLRLHHVNLSIPVSGAEAEAAFLVDYLNYERVPLLPDTPPQAKWFTGADGTQIHLSEDPEHHPSSRAHVAVDFGDSLGELRSKFDESNYEYSTSVGPNGAVMFCQDPAGNRWELRGTFAD